MTLEQALRIANDSLLEREGIGITYYMRDEGEESHEAIRLINQALEDAARAM